MLSTTNNPYNALFQSRNCTMFFDLLYGVLTTSRGLFALKVKTEGGEQERVKVRLYELIDSDTEY